MSFELKLFERRDIHWMGEKTNGSLETLQWRRRNIPRILLAISMLTGLPGLTLLIYEMRHLQNVPLPMWTALFCFLLILVAIPCFAGFLDYRSFCREYDVHGFGYWVMSKKFIIHLFGDDPSRLLPWSEIRSVRLNKQKTQIFLETDGEPMVITCRMRNEPSKGTSFLPFLNSLVRRLGKYDVDLSSLRELQDELRKDIITKEKEPHCSLVELLAFSSIPVLCMCAILIIDANILRDEDVSPFYRLQVMLGLGVLFIATIPIGLRLGKSVRKRRERRIDDEYCRIMSMPPDSPIFKQPAPVSRWKLGNPPRTVTPAARRRLQFGWGAVIGGLILPIIGLFLLFILAAHSSDETVQNTLVGYFAVAMLGLLGFALLLNDRQKGKRFGDLFENGITHKSRVHEIGPMNIIVKTAPQWGGLVKVPKEDTLAPLSPGDRIMLFVDPQNPKRRIILEQATSNVFYDAESNSFDTRSKLPILQLPAAVLFGTMLVAWIVLLGRELLHLMV